MCKVCDLCNIVFFSTALCVLLSGNVQKLAENATHVPEKGGATYINILGVKRAAALSPVTFSYFHSVVIGVF